jgi:hypothetical protein
MRKLYTNPWQWCRSLQKTGIIALALVGTVQNVNAQVSNYAFTQSTSTFNSINSSGVLVAGSDATTSTTNDTAGWTVTLPFNFNFNGADYTSIYVNSNGGATFGATTSSAGSIISSTTGFSGGIGVMSRDLWGVFVTSGVTTSGSDVITNVASFKGIEIGKQLNNVNGIPTGATVTAFDETASTITMSAPATSSSSSAVVRYGSGKIFTAVEGTAPNRVFVIEWIGYNDYSTGVTGSNHLNFQLRLAETSNRISVVYGPSYNINTTSRTNQVGLRGTSNADFNNRSGAAGSPWDSTTAGTTNSASVSRDNTNFPATGLTFSWAPPTCYAPTALTVPAATVTPNGASVSWTAPSIVPGTGYEVYYSTSNTSPTSATVLDATNSMTSATTSVSIIGLLPSTTYYVWVRSVCSGSDKSVWSTASSFVTSCQPPAILNVNGATVCGASGSATISATADSGAIITWYDAATGGNVLGTGNSYTTPVISANTTYYVSARTAGVNGQVGPASPSVLGSVSATNYAIGTYYQIFDVITPTTLVSVDVFPVSSVAIGTSSAVEIRNNAGTTLISVPYTVSVNDGVTPQTVTINYPLAVGTGYRIGQGVGINLNRNTAGATYPYTSGAISVTGNNFSSGPNYWYYIYNWKFSSSCESARQPVNVTVNSACLGTSETSDLKESIKIYPNPFNDVLNISDVENVKSISVTDLAGRLVRTIEKPGSALNLSDLKSGMYMITLYLKDGTQKTIKSIKK